jgi:hypothetical protein
VLFAGAMALSLKSPLYNLKTTPGRCSSSASKCLRSFQIDSPPIRRTRVQTLANMSTPGVQVIRNPSEHLQP